MSTIAIDTVTITDFRSISGTIAIPLNAPVVLLHGANGAGKTTVMSALEFALTGEISDTRGQDQRHLVHRGAKVAEIELSTASGSLALRIDASGSDGTALLGQEDASFFRERCYLAQTTLGRLLETYQDGRGHKDSPLTRFVKDLLRLDELDALIEGIEAVKDKRLVKRLIPEYAHAESEADSHRKLVATTKAYLRNISAETGVLRDQIDEILRGLAAPTAVTSAHEPEDVAGWLEQSDEERALVQLIATRRELQGLRVRWAELGKSAAEDSGVAEVDERAAQEAAAAWRASHGVALDRVLDLLRTDFPAMRSAVGSADPAETHKSALDQVAVELEQARATIEADDLSIVESQRLDDAVKATKARIDEMDRQLGSNEVVSTTAELSKVLAALIPHIHGEDCPVCGRAYGEVSDSPLSARVAMRISELGEKTERLHSLAKARLEAINDLSRAKKAHSSLVVRRIDSADKAAVTAKIMRLEQAQKNLVAMSSGIAQGTKILRCSAEAERTRALAHQRDRAGVEIRTVAASLANSMEISPADDATPIAQAIERLESHVDSRLADIEVRQANRRTATAQLRKLVDAMRTEQELQASLERSKDTLALLEGAIKDLEQRRERIKALRGDAERSRSRVVRQVFNNSLNRMWRDLFICLAPDEPFVPAFRVPDAPGERVSAILETVHRDGKPGGSPAAMLSAGNLNTAALTLFLALHLSVEPQLPWLMLDDPVQSMDEVHISQFAALLRTLSKQHGRRVVIAVHEQSLFDYLALELSPARPGDSLVTVELSRSPEGASNARPTYRTYEQDTALAVA